MNKLIASIFVLSMFVHPGLIVAGDQSPVNGNGQSAETVLPIVKRDSLLNGLQLIVIEQKGTGSMSARLRVNSGALFDLANRGGLADLTAGMLLRGGGGLDATSITDTVEQSGLRVNIAVGWDSTDMVISGPSDSLDTVMDLMSRMVIRPKFDQKEFDALKAMRINELKAEEKEDAEVVRRKAMQVVFGTHPFGRPARGTVESLSNIKRADLLYYHDRFYIANNSELIITGDVTIDQVTRLGRAELGAWKKGEKVPATFRPPAPLSSRQAIILDRSESATAHAALAQIGISRRADDYFAAMVMGELLTRINSNSGSAATIRTYLDPRLLPGPLWIEIASPSDDLNAAIDAVTASMSRLQMEAPALEQVEAAKLEIISAFQERLRTDEGAARTILDIELYGLGRDYMINFVNRVKAITPGDIQQAAKNHLKPQSLAVVIAGSASKFESLMKKNGSVTVMP